MSDLSPRPRGRMSRRQREDLAYRLAVGGGLAAVVAVAGIVLAVVGIVGSWIPILAIIVAAVCGLLFRRTVSG
jgi:lipopolysaccharide export LptBFGC system permease protein LptF